MYIKPNGDVWACPFIPVRMGNVREEGLLLDKIWERLRAHRCKFEFEHGASENASASVWSQCDSCEYQRVCGGCKARMMIDNSSR